MRGLTAKELEVQLGMMRERGWRDWVRVEMHVVVEDRGGVLGMGMERREQKGEVNRCLDGLSVRPGPGGAARLVSFGWTMSPVITISVPSPRATGAPVHYTAGVHKSI